MKKIVLLVLTALVFCSHIQSAYAVCSGKKKAKCQKDPTCTWNVKWEDCRNAECSDKKTSEDCGKLGSCSWNHYGYCEKKK